MKEILKSVSFSFLNFSYKAIYYLKIFSLLLVLQSATLKGCTRQNSVYITPQKLFFLCLCISLAKRLILFYHSCCTLWSISFRLLSFISHFPYVMTPYLYVLSGDGSFLCLRISSLCDLMFEQHYNTPLWLQLDLYKTEVWLTFTTHVYVTSLQHY